MSAASGTGSVPAVSAGTPTAAAEAAAAVTTPAAAAAQESPTSRPEASPGAARGATASEWPLWEVFVRSKAGLDHKHCGSLHAVDAGMAIQLARDVYTRRQEGTSIWVVRSDQIVASDPGEKSTYFDPMEDKVYRHPTFYALPASVDHM